LRIFHNAFPLVTKRNIMKDNGWITPNIKALSQLKKDYYYLKNIWM
jgi:hypothetical protein